MIDTSDVTQALADQLSNYSAFATLLKTTDIKISDYVNEDPARAPWCGVYRRGVSAQPRTLQTPPSWTLTFNVAVVVQAVSISTGKDCEDALENLVSLALDAVLNDRTLGGVINMVNSWSVEYTYLETDRKSTYFQAAMINLEVEADEN